VSVLNEDPVCEHGTALDVHCCGCHSGFLFEGMRCTCMTKVSTDVLGEWIRMVNEEGVNLSKWETSFMESITDQWERSHSLSERQIEILERIYTERTS
jgi:DNA-binding NarL/FixJ family response regulator